MDRPDEIQKRRAEVAELYMKSLRSIPYSQLPVVDRMFRRT